MLIARETAPETFEGVAVGSSFVGSDGALHGWQCVELWTETELNAIGVYRVEPAEPPADSAIKIAGNSFRRVDGKVVQVLDLVQPPPPDKEKLSAYAAARRYEMETAGIVSLTYGPLLTDRDTRAIIGQTIQSLDLGIIQPPVNFKTSNGFVTLDRAAFVAIATAIAAHVQSTFDKEGKIAVKINDGTIATTAEIDAAFTA